MLRGISPLLPPMLLKILCEMGHGDEVVIGDGNFPATSLSNTVVRCDGSTVTEILQAILPLFPLDAHVERPAAIMQIEERDRGKFIPKRWDEYRTAILQYEPDFTDFEAINRFAFYERTKKAFAVVASGDVEIYANLILKKGVMTTPT